MQASTVPRKYQSAVPHETTAMSRKKRLPLEKSLLEGDIRKPIESQPPSCCRQCPNLATVQQIALRRARRDRLR
jgi:hypothetical protein